MVEVTFHKQTEIDDSLLKFAVIAARYKNKWVFCRHKERGTWEIPGGHREAGETIGEAARRELWEETGAVKADIRPVCAYKVWDYGMLYFANITEMEALPKGSEIAEVMLTDKLPTELTYPGIHNKLYQLVQGWLNLQSSADELWDVYDENRNLTGRLHRRGDFLEPGEYHLVVHVWMLNSRGEFLLTKRSPNKGFPNMWESTGGSALAGDDSLTAALREVMEETGLTLNPAYGQRIMSDRESDYFRDVWLFRQDFDLNDVVLQPGETTDKMYVSKERILKMQKDGEFVPYSYLQKFFKAAGI